MKDLLLHPLTRRQFDAFLRAPAHALLLVGPAGSGKATVAARLAETLLELPPDSLADYPYHLRLQPEAGKAIGIEAVRGLEQFLSLKVPRPGAYSRAVIVQNADAMTAEAQNSLLKTLEEPPAGVLIILTAAHEQALLPTLRSRAQMVALKRPERAALEAHFQDQGFDQPAIARAYAMSGGLIGLLQALLAQTEHPLLAATETARRLLAGSAYDRLLLVDELARQRQLALDVTFILQQMAHISLQTASGPAAARWQNVLTASYRAAEALQAAAQPKLALTNLMLEL